MSIEQSQGPAHGILRSRGAESVQSNVKGNGVLIGLGLAVVFADYYLGRLQ